MISETALQKIETLAAQVAVSEGVKIYDVEFGGGDQGRSLRVYIEKEGGVGIEDCAKVSRALTVLLDENDPIPGGQYNLEVSSPGLDRSLKKRWHFEQAIGKTVWIRLDQSLETIGVVHSRIKTAKQLSEILLAVENDFLKFRVEEEDLLIPLANVEKAKMVFDMNEGKQKKSGMNPKNVQHGKKKEFKKR